MTLAEFATFSADDQLSIIEDFGVRIGEREHPHHYICLYQIDAFYAEVFFRKKDDTIWKVGGFDHPVMLQPYLDQIDISNLIGDE